MASQRGTAVRLRTVVFFVLHVLKNLTKLKKYTKMEGFEQADSDNLPFRRYYGVRIFRPVQRFEFSGVKAKL